jgi:hypothetical protein
MPIFLDVLCGGTGSGSNPHLAEDCDDDLCPRLPCRMWKGGYEQGYWRGYEQGQADYQPKVIYIYVPVSGG